MAQSHKEFKSSDLQTAFSSGPVFTPKLVWIQPNSLTRGGLWVGQMNRSWKSDQGLEIPQHDATPAQKGSWRDCSQAKLWKLFWVPPHWVIDLFFLSTFAVHALFSHLVPFLLHLSRIETISADQVKDYLEVSLKHYLCPSQEIYILRGSFRKWKIWGAQRMGL